GRGRRGGDRRHRASPPRRGLPALPASARPHIAGAALPGHHLAARRGGMSTLAIPARRPFGPRLVRAEIMKLATRRGLMIASFLLTVGATLVTFGVLAVLHQTDPTHHKLIGGLSPFHPGMFTLP